MYKRIKDKNNQENLTILIKITDVFYDVEKSDNYIKINKYSNYLTITGIFLFTKFKKSGIVLYINEKGEDSDHEENK